MTQGVHRLYQWLSRQASLFRSESSGEGMDRTARTGVTIEQQETTLLVGGTSMGFHYCPFCGQKIAATQAERAWLRLKKVSIDNAQFPVGRDLP